MNKILFVILFLVLSCSSIPHRPTETKLDLSEERQLVEDSKNIDPYQKQIILGGFDRADSVNESLNIYVKDLEKENKKLKSDLVSEKEDAEAYRRWRFRVFAFLGILFLWETRNLWLPIFRKLIGISI